MSVIVLSDYFNTVMTIQNLRHSIYSKTIYRIAFISTKSLLLCTHKAIMKDSNGRFGHSMIMEILEKAQTFQGLNSARTAESVLIGKK